MTRRPPRSTRTDTLFPYTTLFRSSSPCRPGLALALPNNGTLNSAYALRTSCERGGKIAMSSDGVPGLFHCAPWPYRLFCCSIRNETVAAPAGIRQSSEERRVGKEVVMWCRTRVSPLHEKKKK